MAKTDFVLALVRAHYARQDPWFKQLVMQVVSQTKDERKKEALLAEIRTLTALPPGSEQFFVPLKPVTLDDLILTTETRGELLAIADELRYRVALVERGLPPRSRLLFHGPPGNGKTSAACAIAETLNVPAYGLAFGTVIDSHMGVTGANLTKVFEALRTGSLVVIDEFDALASARESGVGGDGHAATKEQNRTVSTLLTLLDRVDQGILVATTNRLDMLDSAVLRRFDVQVELAAPELEQQWDLARRLVKKYGLRDGGDMCRFTSHSYSGVTQKVLDEARRVALADIRKKEQVA